MQRIIATLFVPFFCTLWVYGQDVADIEKRYPKIEFFKVTSNIKMSVDSVRGYACRLAYEQYSPSDGGHELWINDPGMDPVELVNESKNLFRGQPPEI